MDEDKQYQDDELNEDGPESNPVDDVEEERF